MHLGRTQFAAVFVASGLATILVLSPASADAAFQRTPTNIATDPFHASGFIAIDDSSVSYNKANVRQVFADMYAPASQGISFKLCSEALGGTSITICDSAVNGTGPGYQNPDLCTGGSPACNAWSNSSYVGNYAWASYSATGSLGTGPVIDGIFEAYF